MIIAGPQRITLRDLLRIRAFAVLFPAGVVSDAGNVLARLALSVLVFDRTGSAAAAALTYATSFVPAVAGGFAFGRLADRFSRRSVMIATDVLRAALFATMSLTGLPIAALVVLLAVAVFIGPAFSSAELAHLADELTPEQYRTSSGIRGAVDQATQVLGFGVGGLVIAAVSPTGALLADALTFLGSAGSIAAFLPRVRRSQDTPDLLYPGSAEPELIDAGAQEQPFAGVWRDMRTRWHMIFTVLVSFFVLPEALAVALATSLRASTGQIGLLSAMLPLGAALGSAVIVRVPPRPAVTETLAVLAGLPLVVSAVSSQLTVICAAWLLTGALTAYQVNAMSALVGAIPAASRSTAIGSMGAWLAGTQGVAFAVGGALAAQLGPGEAAAVAGLAGAGTTVVVVVARRWRASTHESG